MDEVRKAIGEWMLDVLYDERWSADTWAVRAGVSPSIISRMVAVKTRSVREIGTIPGTQSLHKLASVVSKPLDLGVLAYNRPAPQQQNYDTDWLSREDTLVWIWASDTEHKTMISDMPSNMEHEDYRHKEIFGKTRWEFAGGDVLNDPLWRHHKSDMDAHVPIENFVYEYTSLSGGIMRCRVDALPVFKRSKFHGYRGTAIILNLSVEARSAFSR